MAINMEHIVTLKNFGLVVHARSDSGQNLVQSSASDRTIIDPSSQSSDLGAFVLDKTDVLRLSCGNSGGSFQ